MKYFHKYADEKKGLRNSLWNFVSSILKSATYLDGLETSRLSKVLSQLLMSNAFDSQQQICNCGQVKNVSEN